MKKGWQQIMLYLIVLTSYGCLSDEDKIHNDDGCYCNICNKLEPPLF